METDSKTSESQFISARDVSRLLNINEKKVYTLAQKGKIPCTKVTGKWIFPKKELERFLHRKATGTLKKFSTEFALAKNILLIAGSDDPILYPLQGMIHSLHRDFVLFSASVGSGEGLRLLKKSFCHIALCHLYDYEADDYNFSAIRALFDNPDEVAVINLFYRTIGFLTKEQQVGSFEQIVSKRLRFINRQAGSGIRSRVDRIIAEEKIEKNSIKGYGDEVNTHFNIASAILSDRADAGVTAESVARYFNLKFTKLFEERFDMVVYKDSYFEENIQIFIEFIKSSTFMELLATMAGYSSRQTGKVLYPKNQTSEG
ncbi:MAG: helix-turn-helix transcriptional regulator [Spirochaetota bacterium]|nr:MAG: helix-turn-helix transcriptional regulator [Spirochaetota bacterium]